MGDSLRVPSLSDLGQSSLYRGLQVGTMSQAVKASATAAVNPGPDGKGKGTEDEILLTESVQESAGPSVLPGNPQNERGAQDKMFLT